MLVFYCLQWLSVWSHKIGSVFVWFGSGSQDISLAVLELSMQTKPGRIIFLGLGFSTGDLCLYTQPSRTRPLANPRQHSKWQLSHLVLLWQQLRPRLSGLHNTLPLSPGSDGMHDMRYTHASCLQCLKRRSIQSVSELWNCEKGLPL